MTDYNELAECFRNVYKSDTGINPRENWSPVAMQSYLDHRAAHIAANEAAGRDSFDGI